MARVESKFPGGEFKNMKCFSSAQQISCICVSLLKYHTELLCWENERKAASENYVCGLIFQNPVIDMQKAADKRSEQPELAENLCAICSSNVSKTAILLFSFSQQYFLSRIQGGSELAHVDSERSEETNEDMFRAMFCTSSHKL